MRRIIPYILVALAVLNLVWLFGFDYKIPSFFYRITVRETQSTEEEVSVPETEDAAQVQEPAEEAPHGEETEQEALQETNLQETADAGETPAAAGEPAAVSETPAASGEPAAEAGERTCRPADGNTPNIRSGPGQDYGVIRMARYDEVMIIRGEDEGGWLPIRTQDGEEGYVFSGMLIIDEQTQ